MCALPPNREEYNPLCKALVQRNQSKTQQNKIFLHITKIVVLSGMAILKISFLKNLHHFSSDSDAFNEIISKGTIFCLYLIQSLFEHIGVSADESIDDITLNIILNRYPGDILIILFF